MRQPDPLTRAAALHGRAIDLRATGSLVAAEAAAQQAERLFAQHAGANHPDTVHARVESGEIAELRGDLPHARSLLAQASRALRATVTAGDAPDDVATLYLRAWLGSARVAQLQGQYAAAERTLREALRWVERTYGRRHSAVASVLTALGVLRKAQGRYAEALALYRRALPAVRAQRGATADLATLYHNLAGSEHARGRLAAALPYARRGLAIRRRAFGPRDPGVVADEAALAPILEGLGKRAEAERLYRRSLAYYRRQFGPKSYDVAVTLGNLGALHRNAGNLAQAESSFRKGLAIEEPLLGARHPELALSLNNLAVVLAARGKIKEAAAAYERALAIFAATVGPKHPYAVGCRKNLERLGTPARHQR